MGFFSWPRGTHLTTLQHFRLPSENQILEGKILWLSLLNLTDIAYNSNSHKILELVYVKYNLSKNGFILKTAAMHLCPKCSLNLATRWLFTSIIQYTNAILGLKLLTIGTNVTKVFCVQRKKLNLVLLRMETDVATHNMQASLKGTSGRKKVTFK